MPWSLPPRAVLLRRALIALAALLLLWALAWLALPPLLKSQAQARLSALLGREVSIGEVDFKPWSLELTVRDLSVAGLPGASEPLLRWSRAHVNADMASLWRRAPVIAGVELDGLQLRVARVAPGRYDIDDLIERFRPAPQAEASEPVRFALYNVQVRDADLRFDDRPAQHVHRIEALQIGLPFLSNLPAHLEATVEPRVAFRYDGAAFDSGAQAVPFAQRRHGELSLRIADLDLAPFAPYVPASLPLRLRSGVLGAELTLRFELPEAGEARMVLAGRTALKTLALHEPSGAPLLAWSQLDVALRDMQPLARRVALGEVRLQGAQLHLARETDGRVQWQRLFAGGAPAEAAPPAASTSASGAASAPASAGWQAAVDALVIEQARILWDDATTAPPAALQLEAVELRAAQLAWPMAAPAPVTLEASLRRQGAQAAPAGRLRIEARAGERSASGDLALDGLQLAEFAPYLAQALRPRLEGRASLAGRFDWSADPAAPRLQLLLDRLGLDALRLVRGSGRAAQEEVALKQLTLADARIDLIAHELELGRVAIVQPAVALRRDGQGRWNVASFAAPASGGSRSAPSAPAGDAAPAWKLRLKDLQLDGGRVQLADSFAAGRAADTPLRIDATALRLRVQDAAWPAAKGGTPARVQFGAKVAGARTADSGPPTAGSLEWNGRLVPEPLQVAGRLRIERFPVHAFEPYFADRVPLALLRAEAGWQGDVDVRQSAAGWAVTASGDARLADVRVHVRGDAAAGAGDELLSWQSLTLDGLRFAMAPQATPQLEIGAAALNDFFARLVVTEQGRLNLSSVAAAEAAASAPDPAASAAAPAAPASAASAAEPAGPPLAIAVGGVKLSNGRIDFNDRFVRPNYSANLTELNGTLGAFRSGSSEMAALELRGRAAGTALLDIRGSLNPTAQPLALDLQAKATDLELAPLSPYAGKYAGYAIERGKLSVELAYKIAPDGRLEARNQVILNQLTFGDKVDSPDATKLPVLLAVALLKDRNGVIDINLPVSGSINDPQFSVFGIVLKVIGNLLVKALTAPFALLAGGGSDDLSLVEFRPGTALPTDAGRAALDKVAKALADRGALKMTVTGTADPAAEREAFQQAALDARLLAERRRELLRAGASSADADAVVSLDEAVRARVLKEVYRATDLPDKPRNPLGFARDIPGPEMEALLKRRIPVGTDAMRELALQRGLAVRDALLAQGLPGERLFLAAPKLRGEGDAEPGWTPRVQLTLSTR